METADEELLCACGPELAADDPARVERISAELAASFAAMRNVTRAASVFGSGRAPRGGADYRLARGGLPRPSDARGSRSSPEAGLA